MAAARIRLKILVVSAATTLACLLLEVGLRLFLSHLPLKAWALLPPAILPLAQYSKVSTLPSPNYLLILGDSYAVGEGDWYWSGDRWGRPPFSVSHLLFQRLDRDVISLGQAGAGSMRGLVTEPARFYEMSRHSWIYPVTIPSQIVAFFYEGNDLNDNLAFEEAEENRAALTEPVTHGLAHDILLWQILTRRWAADDANVGPDIDPPGSINQVIVGKQTHTVPNGLQSPALELSGAEREAALGILKEALTRLSELFPKTPIAVVYIPSPLASYRIASPTIDAMVYSDDGRDTVYDASTVRVASDQIATQVREIAKTLGMAFIDSRPRIWRETQHRFVHGPNNWQHLNELGYTALAEAIVEGLPLR